MEFEIIPTEYATGHLAGHDYGSKVRVAMRSPKGILYVAYGVHYVTRAEIHRWPTHVAGDSKKDTMRSEKVLSKVVELFGEGADKALLATLDKRGFSTALIDGGGDRLPLPRAEAGKIFVARYESIIPNWEEEYPKTAKHCIQCGGGLERATIHHSLKPHHPGEGDPKTIEDCQRLSNHPVIRVRGYGSNTPEEWWPYVNWFETWDGETYVDDTFCSDRCASIYGRRAAAELARLKEGGSVPEQHGRRYNRVDHAPKEEPAWINGIRIK